jgi:hypothetical protein
MRAALALLAAVPSLALAQAGALNAAREAGARQQAGVTARQQAADAQLVEGEAAARAPAPVEPAAASLEGQVGPLPGTEVQEGAAPGPAAGKHTVARGDTLWDLSAKYLSDAWSWPKIWSWNPDIANPHWIYPGNVIRLGPADGGAAVAAPVPASADDDSDLATPPRELADFSRAEMRKPQEIGEGDEVGVAGAHRVGYVAPRGTRAKHDSFVTRGELAEAGVLSASFEDKLLLTVQDRAYAQFDRGVPVKTGQTYAIFRTERELRHPETKQLFGYKTTIVGAARVVAVEAKAATLQISAASEPIERGFYLAPWPEKSRTIARKPNHKQVDGIIVGAEVDVVSEIGEHHLVYVDRGTSHGVEDGNVFTVLRSGDPYGKDIARASSDPALPIEEVGSLLVLDAKEHASTALVVRSDRELLIGDRVEMRLASSGGAAVR